MRTVHPSPEAIRLAMSRIQRAVGAYGGDQEVPMDRGIVHRHGCRTTACHAGWYALGRFMDHSAVRWLHDETFYTDPGETLMALTPDGKTTHLMYHDGAHVLARDLGFMNAPALKGWAERHPDIWGGARGDRMFAGDGAMAFGKAPFAPVMVSEIVAWCSRSPTGSTRRSRSIATGAPLSRCASAATPTRRRPSRSSPARAAFASCGARTL